MASFCTIIPWFTTLYPNIVSQKPWYLGDDKNYSIGIAIASIIFYKTMVIKKYCCQKGGLT
jgi:hypothetical protein